MAFQTDKTKKGRQACFNKPTFPVEKVQLKAEADYERVTDAPD